MHHVYSAQFVVEININRRIISVIYKYDGLLFLLIYTGIRKISIGFG